MSLLLLLFFGFANGVLEHQSDDNVQIEESESQQILKELNVKWDAESAGIITFEVQYSRCHVAYIHLKEFTANDVSLFVEKLVDKDSDEFFDKFFNYFVEPKSFEKPHPTSTQPFRSRVVSQNFFRYSGQRRWEKTVHPGNFMFNGEHILDFFDIYYTDDEKYINCSQLNKDLKIGNIANFHMSFAYLMDFLQQPEERREWVNPKIEHNREYPNILNITSHGGIYTYKVDRARGVLLKSTETREGSVYEQIFPLDFFSPAKNLWVPRTVLIVTYIPKKILEQNFTGDQYVPYTVHFHKIEDIKINEPMPDSAFYVPAEKGTVVWDYRDNMNEPLIVQAYEDIQDVISWVDSQKPKFVLHGADDKPFQTLSARCNSTMFNVSGIPSGFSNIQWLELFFNPQMTGNCTGEIELKTNHPSAKTIKIQLEGLVK